LMGFSLVEVEEGRVVFAGEPDERLYNPMGAVHGGYAATMLDSAMGCAVNSALPAGAAYTTLELSVNLVRAITAETGLGRAEGRTLPVGRAAATARGAHARRRPPGRDRGGEPDRRRQRQAPRARHDELRDQLADPAA